MNIFRPHFNCNHCQIVIDKRVSEYSRDNFGHPLCMDCQDWLRQKIDDTSVTKTTFDLYIALKLRGVPAELEKFDGYKTIDIAVVEAKVNIEVDGGQHNFNANQALSDLKRTYFSFKKGFLTLRIPNALVTNHLEQTADYVTDFLTENLNRNN